MLAGIPGLLPEFLAWDQGAIEADEGAVEALPLHQEVQERAPDFAVAGPPMPEAQAPPVGDAGWGTRAVKVAQEATRTEQPQDAGQELVVGVVRPASWGLGWLRETLRNKSELPWGEDVGRRGTGHRRLLGLGRTPQIVCPEEF